MTSVDLGATLLDITGSRTLFPKSVDGASFWSLVHGGDRAYDRPAYYEAVVGAMNANRPGLSGFGVRTSQWKFVLYNNGKRELYDLVRDPHELTNLVLAGRRRPAVLADLTRITEKLKRCDGKACRTLLPKKYRRTAAQAQRDLAKQLGQGLVVLPMNLGLLQGPHCYRDNDTARPDEEHRHVGHRPRHHQRPVRRHRAPDPRPSVRLLRPRRPHVPAVR